MNETSHTDHFPVFFIVLSCFLFTFVWNYESQINVISVSTYDTKGNCCKKKSVPAHTTPSADGRIYVEMLSGWLLSTCKHTSEINFAASQQKCIRVGLDIQRYF